MEKRTLIALALSLLVLVFWEYYFNPTRTPQTPPQQAAAPVSPPAAPQPQAPAAPMSGSLQALPQDRLTQLDQHFDSWTVESSLYKMQILSPGARINSFQLKQFRREVDPGSDPMELVPSRLSGYLPLAIDLLQHQDWKLSTRNFLSDSPGLISLLPREPSRGQSFATEIPGKVRLTKTLTFSPDSYVVDLQVQVQNLSQENISDQLGISFYFQPYTNAAEESSYNPSQLTIFEKGATANFPVKELVKKEPSFTAPLDWVGYENNYFIQSIIPIDTAGYKIVPRVVDAEKQLIQVVYLTDPFLLGGNEEKIVKLRLYLGPKQMSQLDKAGHNLTKSVDYGWFTIVAKPLVYVLDAFYRFTRNYGVAIILLTVIIKILFWPLTHYSFKSMKSMKKIQPKIAQLREKYKDDKEKLNQEMLGLYRTYKVNPLGGCLPMVLQIPVFFALYRMLNGAVELRHQPFMWWINDLTAPDRLHIGINIPYLGGLPVLTILMGISMFVQQKMTPSAGDPRQEQIMLFMPVIFTVFFINFPSGLVLYWLVNNVLSIAQQYWVNRHA
ncbi:MAG: membrane protein insertase YidC [Syntrophobacteraceae bacterium]